MRPKSSTPPPPKTPVSADANQGTLTDGQVASLLTRLHQGHETGILTLEGDKTGTHRLYLMDGDILLARVSQDDLRLGRHLLRTHQITQNQLETALKLRTPELPLDLALLQTQAITAEKRDEAHALLFKSLLQEAYLIRSGEYHFEPQDAIIEENLQLFFDTEQLMAEAESLANEVQVLSGVLQQEAHIYQCIGRPGTGNPVAPLQPEQTAVLNLLDGKRSTNELFILSPLEMLQTLQLLTVLLEANLIRKVGQRPVVRPELLPSFPLLPEELQGQQVIAPEETPAPHEDEDVAIDVRATRKIKGTRAAHKQPPKAADAHVPAASATVAATLPEPVPPTVQEAAPEEAAPEGETTSSHIPAHISEHIEAALDQLLPVSAHPVDAPSSVSSPVDESLIHSATVGHDIAAGHDATLSHDTFGSGAADDGLPFIETGVTPLIGDMAQIESALMSTLHAESSGEPVSEAPAQAQTSQAIADQDLSGHDASALDGSETSAAATEGAQASATPESPAQPESPAEPEIQELWSDTPVFQPRDHSNPSAGVFLSGDSVLDTVDLSHIHRFEIATDIPLDGIVETSGAEDEEGYGSEEDSDDSESEGDSLSLSPADVLNLENTGDLGSPDESWDAAGVLGDVESALADDQIESLSVHDIVDDTTADDSSIAEAAPPIFDEEGDDGLEDLDAAGGIVEDDYGDEDYDDDYPEDDYADADAYDSIDGLDDVDVLPASALDLSSDEEADVLRPEDIAQVNSSGELDPRAVLQGAPLLPLPTRIESRSEPPARQETETHSEDDEVPLLLSSGIQPLEGIDDDFVQTESLLGLEQTQALFQPVKPMTGMARGNVRPSQNDMDELTPEEQSLLAHINGIFRARTEDASERTSSRGGRKRAARSDLRRNGATVSLNAAQKSLLRERAEMYNHIFSVIFTHLGRKQGREKARLLFQDFFAPGNGSYPEMFQNLVFKGDGMIDAELLLKNLEGYPTHRPIQLFEACLNDIFHFLIRQVDQVLDPGEQGHMMDGLSPLFNLLTKRSDPSP